MCVYVSPYVKLQAYQNGNYIYVTPFNVQQPFMVLFHFQCKE
jgi:hypothetical protein